ncbi:MAG: lytic transglycosylase domain-containing protein, partial [Opitutaceae bacterium]
ELMPTLRAAFVAEGVPPELAWLAEAESTLDPEAESPVGARGLFQLMPATARSLGLSTTLPDERTNVEKSARAAAHYLRTLHGKFGDWPLAFAAYNAGEGRVRRLLAAHSAHTFADISAALSNETRMYVPKVCATIAVRTGVSPAKLAAPRSVTSGWRETNGTPAPTDLAGIY